MIAVTGATGNLGKLAIDALLKQGVKPQDIVAVIRNKNKAQDLVSKGITVREADYGNSQALEKALQGADKLLLISGSEVGQRVSQHTNIVNAAQKAGVQFIAYTSILRANESKMELAKEHFATEKMIENSGITHAFLRNSWYIENYTEQFGNTLKSGVIGGAARDGKISAATRADYAEAAAKVILGDTSKDAIYELGGAAFTLTELAAVTSKVSGKNIEYKDMPAAEFSKLLTGFGLPSAFAEILADSDVGIARGDLFTDRDDLKKLLGRNPTSLEEAVKKAVQQYA
ncbi:SDR family oxidoreductase [Bdellovibrio sp. SKB1291214]|uniref:SDR family oxidoreductase n=1 Tax=Bdellovibrio sp. SKB1291214 TaxID=1732569 RepID=UPI000B51DDBF|nr:SDR family oxidoreductase [Bdellovibrio sp. SKB1291214]UYL08547.1 SDR family oxidoreductase [Bdellovibrio sp. SKB1291214]